MKRKILNGLLAISIAICMLILTIVCIITFVCHDSQKMSQINSDEVVDIKVGYLPKDIETIASLRSWDDVISMDGSRIDTTIVDRDFITKYVKMVNNLEKSETQYCYDLRIVTLLRLKDGTKKFVCFGDKQGIVYDNVLMKNDKELIDMLDSILYTKSAMRRFAAMDFEQLMLSNYTETKEFDSCFMLDYEYYMSHGKHWEGSLLSKYMESIIKEKDVSR